MFAQSVGRRGPDTRSCQIFFNYKDWSVDPQFSLCGFPKGYGCWLSFTPQKLWYLIVDKTRISHSQFHHKSLVYKPVPNGWWIIVLPTLP